MNVAPAALANNPTKAIRQYVSMIDSPKASRPFEKRKYIDAIRIMIAVVISNLKKYLRNTDIKKSIRFFWVKALASTAAAVSID
jgi:aminopeptidase C